MEADQKFFTAFASFFAGCVRIYKEFAQEQGFSSHDVFEYEHGTRYMKVIRGSSVHCFVDKKTGDVLKPHNWKAPAKHARGNIYDEQNGLGMMGWCGPAYLR